ncbi:MAG: hypothetical protein GYB67_05840 [Chloroflexi bacterium]|nr:hypothetical protein [Chloroflexota bacterium]
MQMKRENIAWLMILAALVGIVVLSGVASVEVTAALIGLYLFALIGSFVNFQPTRLLDQSRSSLLTLRMSTEAREAVERARRRGSFAVSGITLLDVGLIATQEARSGLVMQRTRTVSLDDDGIRPFIKLNVSPDKADRQVRFRFEFVDQNGDPQYVHEMRTYLRDGEMDILPDHQLPLAENARLDGSGDWDLRVYLDGSLLGAHTFSVGPSLQARFADAAERRGAERAQGAANRLDVGAATDDDRPMTLEELLRSRDQEDGRSQQQG